MNVPSLLFTTVLGTTCHVSICSERELYHRSPYPSIGSRYERVERIGVQYDRRSMAANRMDCIDCRVNHTPPGFKPWAFCIRVQCSGTNGGHAHIYNVWRVRNRLVSIHQDVNLCCPLSHILPHNDVNNAHLVYAWIQWHVTALEDPCVGLEWLV